MKLILCVFLMLISAKECDKNKSQMTNESQATATIDMTEKRIQDNTKIVYQAVSRGYYLDITMEGNTMIIANNRDATSAQRYELPAEDARELLNILSDINEKKLPELQAPSKDHQFDGAAIATLAITTSENTYKTVAFDHGNPPESIRALVKKMLSLKERMEKQ